MPEINENSVIKIGNALIITRIFDAPRELVWRAWTDPEHAKQWWGPKNFTAPSINMDLRIGGKYLSCMKAENGKEYWSTGVYKEIVPFEKLVCTDNFSDEHGNIVSPASYGITGDWPDELIITVTLEDIDGKTKMTLKHEGLPAGQMRDMAGLGWNESFDKLAESFKQD